MHEFTKYLLIHGFHTLPVFCIIGMYVKLSLRIKRTHIASQSFNELPASLNDNTKNYRKKKSSSQIIKRTIVGLVVCYLPYIICWQYVSSVMMKRDPLKSYKGEVRWHKISRDSWYWIYKTCIILKLFKKLIFFLIFCYRFCS